MNEPKRELLKLIRSKLTDGMTADDVIQALRPMLFEVSDDWDEIDVTTLDQAVSEVLDQRWLVVRIPREAVRRSGRPMPNRAAGIEP